MRERGRREASDARLGGGGGARAGATRLTEEYSAFSLGDAQVRYDWCD